MEDLQDIRALNTPQIQTMPSRLNFWHHLGVLFVLLGLSCLAIGKYWSHQLEGPFTEGDDIFVLWSISSVIVLSVASLLPPIVVAVALIIVASAAKLIYQNIKNKHSKFSNGAHTMPRVAHYLYVMGSGGHTTEMIALIKLTHRPKETSHRSYLVNHGDQHSQNQIRLLEGFMKAGRPERMAGTSRHNTITRARSVHQSYLSTIFTTLVSGRQILAALVTIPPERAADPDAELFRHPDVIITNGPATGFICAVAAFVLKTLWFPARGKMKVVFVETWARGHELSLTGKLFSLTNLANVFVVQSKELADKLNVPCIGNVNEAWAKMGYYTSPVPADTATETPNQTANANHAEKATEAAPTPVVSKAAARRVRLAA